MITSTDKAVSTASAAQARQPAADDQHVGEEVRDVLGMKGNQISGSRMKTV